MSIATATKLSRRAEVLGCGVGGLDRGQGALGSLGASTVDCLCCLDRPDAPRVLASDGRLAQVREQTALNYDAMGQSFLHLLAPVAEGRASLLICLVGSGVTEYVPLRLGHEPASLCTDVGVLGVGSTAALLLREELLEQDLPLLVQLGVQALAVLQTLLLQLPFVLVFEVLLFCFLVLY